MPRSLSPVVLPGDPTAALQASTRQYIDAQILTRVMGTTPTATKTANYTASVGEMVMVDASGGPVTVTLPVIAANGQRVAVKKIDTSANIVTVAAGAGNTIGSSGAASVPLRTPDQTGNYQSFGTNWVLPHSHLSVASLDARYANTLDVRLARPVQAEGHPPTLTRTQAALLTRTTAPLDILCIGDSITEGTGASTFANRWVAQLPLLLRSLFPQPGIAGGQGFIPALNIATTFTNGWTLAGANSGNGTMGLGHRTAVLSSPNGSMTRTVSGTSITIAYTRTTSTGSFQVFLDGSGTAALTVNTATGASATVHDDGRASLSLGTRGSHSVKIAWSAGSDVYINGIFVYDQDESAGIRLTESGQHGSRSGDWSPAATSSAYVLDDDMTLLQPDLVIIELGANDMIGAVTPATFKTNILDIISHVKSAVTPTPDILLMAAYDIGQNGYNYPWQSYVGQLRQIESADTAVSLLDLSAVLPRSNETDYGLIYSDGVHPNDNGHNLIARTIRDYIAQGFHASAHAVGGSDPLTPSAIGAEASANKGAANGYAPLVSSLVPVANLPGATTSAAGIIQLAGDLTGTSTAPKLVANTTRAATGSTAVTDADGVVVVTPSGATATATLPTPVGRAGKRFIIAKAFGTTGFAVSIATAAGTVGGNATEVIMVSGGYREVVSDNANWIIIGGTVLPVIVTMANPAQSSTLAPDSTMGTVYRWTPQTGVTALTLGNPTNGVDGDQINLEITPVAALTLTVSGPSLTTNITSPISIAAGKKWFGGLRFSGSTWYLIASTTQS